MIRGYPHRPSVIAGEMLRLHIAAEAPLRFQIWFYRQGESLLFKARTEAMLADSRPLGAPDHDWDWPVYKFPIPRDWESGAYIALFVPAKHADAHDPADPDQREAAALFVVKSRRPSGKMLYKLPLFTYHAFNELGEPRGSLYTGGYDKLTLRRPGGGVGGKAWDCNSPDDRDRSSMGQTFWHLDAPFIGWLERRDLEVDYCTDLDIHKNLGNFIAGYRLLLSVGPDEYWSEAMRRHVVAFLKETGGNIAFFSGNPGGSRIRLVDDHTAFICERTDRAGIRRSCDASFQFHRENRLTGINTRQAEGWGKREPIGYTMRHADHWVFEGTGLRDGDVFGTNHGVPGDDRGVSDDFTILGTARTGPNCTHDTDNFPAGRTDTMGIYANNGVVFTAATTDWPQVLIAGDPHVEKITENILRHLGSGRTEHPVVGAWTRLDSKHFEPNYIELLEEQGARNCVYRLDGVGPGGTTVIAKRCVAQEAHVEQTIYQKILPHLPISSLSFYGCAAEPETEYSWLFLEDAGGEEFAYSSEKHRTLAVRWLGQMHVTAARIPTVTNLPDRGPNHYLEQLRATRELIEGHLGNSLLKPDDWIVVKAILSQGHLLESRWDCVEDVCHRFPRTLAHGDFTKGNVRVRSRPGGGDFVAFDWGMAGYGIAGIDIAATSGQGATRDRIEIELVDYWAVVREWWSDLDLAAIKNLADIGAVFRMLAAISWASESSRYGLWPIRELDSYHVKLAATLEDLGICAQSS